MFVTEVIRAKRGYYRSHFFCTDQVWFIIRDSEKLKDF